MADEKEPLNDDSSSNDDFSFDDEDFVSFSEDEEEEERGEQNLTKDNNLAASLKVIPLKKWIGIGIGMIFSLIVSCQLVKKLVSPTKPTVSHVEKIKAIAPKELHVSESPSKTRVEQPSQLNLKGKQPEVSEHSVDQTVVDKEVLPKLNAVTKVETPTTPSTTVTPKEPESSNGIDSLAKAKSTEPVKNTEIAPPKMRIEPGVLLASTTPSLDNQIQEKPQSLPVNPVVVSQTSADDQVQDTSLPNSNTTALTPAVKETQEVIKQENPENKVELQNQMNQLATQIEQLNAHYDHVHESTLKNEKQFTAFKQSINELYHSVDALNHNLNTMMKKVERSTPPRHLVQKHPKPAQPTIRVKEPVKAQTAPLPHYYVSAVIPGRAWIQTSRNNVTTVKVGDVLPYYGTVMRIDPVNGTVMMRSGKVIEYGINEF